MGTCWSDQVRSPDEERFAIERNFKNDGDPVFYKKQMNPDVEPEVERAKRVNILDGLSRKEETHRSIVAISYWLFLNQLRHVCCLTKYLLQLRLLQPHLVQVVFPMDDERPLHDPVFILQVADHGLNARVQFPDLAHALLAHLLVLFNLLYEPVFVNRCLEQPTDRLFSLVHLFAPDQQLDALLFANLAAVLRCVPSILYHVLRLGNLFPLFLQP